jgi:general secretion pathway protein D
VLYTRGQKGWSFGTFKIGKSESAQGLAREAADGPRTETISIEKSPTGDIVSRKAEFESSIKSKTILVSDTAAVLDKVKNELLPMIDKKPKQVLIETRLIEVNRDKLRDLGVDWGLGGTSNAVNTALTSQSVAKNADGLATATAGAHSLFSEVTPSLFGPKEGTTLIPGTEPYNIGAQLVLQKLSGTKFQAVVHALEEDANANTLSAPRIVTLDNQEASILVGYHTPILVSTVATSDAGVPTITQTLDYYQEIGIRLNVVPQVNEDGYINMIIHPSVTSSTTSVPATSTSGATTTTTSYPIIDVREAQTQILVKDQETIVIGGLLKDVMGKQTMSIPFLGKLPLIGGAFRRDTYDTQKIDLLMFITAKIVPDGGLTDEELAEMESSVGKNGDKYVLESKKSKKKAAAEKKKKK